MSNTNWTEYFTNGAAVLKVNVACDVEVLPFVEDGRTARLASNKVGVDIEGDGVTVNQAGDAITISHASPHGGSIGNIVVGNIAGGQSISIVGGVISGRSITTSGGTTIITGGSGRVIINGKTINLDDVADDAPPPPSVRVYVNHPVVVEFSLEGAGKLTIEPMVVEVFGAARHQASVIVKDLAGPLDVSLTNAATITATVQGSVKVSASNSSRAIIAGSLESVDATASNSSSISTGGTCAGSYTANASNASSISHRGTIQGRVRKSATNASVVNV